MVLCATVNGALYKVPLQIYIFLILEVPDALIKGTFMWPFKSEVQGL